jgi:predicted TPR repeat methyltransferase
MHDGDLDLDDRFLQAFDGFKKGDLSHASEICEQILTDCPDYCNALHLSGIMDYRLKNFEEAALKIFKAIQNDPQNPYYFYNLGLALKAQKKNEEAFSFFQNALALKSSQPEKKKSPKDQSKREDRLATEAYRHSIESGQDPSYLAFHFHKEGKLEDAEYVYNQILKESPQNDRTQNDLGNVLQEMGRMEEASACFRKAMEANANLDQAPYNLANVLSELGQEDEAIKLYRCAIKIRPQFFEAHFNLGLVFESLENLDLAFDCYREATKINPNFAKAHYKAAGIYQQWEKTDEALVEYQKAVELDPNHAEAQYYFADLVKSQGDLEKAVALSSHAFAVGEAANIFEGGIILETIDKDGLKGEATKDEFLTSALTGKTPATAPSDYVRSFFDEFSRRFEKHLVDNLQYKVPRLMRDAYDSVLPNGCKFKNGVDLGCGTGLSGEAFISLAERLTGVDLSPNMIEKSKEKEIYEALYEDDILKFLNESKETFDLFIAADVLIYLGDPIPFFEKIKKAAADGAIIVLSTESCDEGDYHIRQTGRYAHNKSSIEEVASRFGFKLLLRNSAGLRMEKEQWVDGDIFVFKFLN